MWFPTSGLRACLYAVALLGFLGFACTATAQAAEAENLLPIGAFAKAGSDGAPEGWKLVNAHGGDSCQVIREGERSMVRFKFAQPRGNQAVGTKLSLDPSWKKLKISVEMRAKDLTVGSKVWERPRIQVTFTNALGKQTGGWPPSPMMDKDTNWTPWSQIIDIPSDAVTLNLMPGMWNSAGVADFANLSVSVAEADKANPRAAGIAATPGTPSTPSTAAAGTPSTPAPKTAPTGDNFDVYSRREITAKPVTGAPDFALVKIAVTIHVAQTPAANDANDGSTQAPVRTLGKALTLAKAALSEGKPTRIIIQPGVYREIKNQLVGENDAIKNTPLIIEGTEKGKVIINGAQVLKESWTANADGTLTAKWPVTLTPAAQFLKKDKADQAIGFRREVVRVNGQLLKQTLDAANIPAGGFVIDDAQGKITVRPAPGMNLATATVEYATGSDDGVKTLYGLLEFTTFNAIAKESVALRNLVFEMSDARFGNFCTVRLGAKSLIEDCIIRHNNCGGLMISSDSTLRRCDISDNGAMGVFNWGVLNLLIEDSTFDRNNWRGVMAGYTGWSIGAIKSHSASNMVIRNCKVRDNDCVGLWWDLWCYHVLIENCELTGQKYEPALLFELSRLFTVRNCTIAHNIEGIRLHDSGQHTFENVTLDDNTLHFMIFSSPPTRDFANPGKRGDQVGEEIYAYNLVLNKVRFISNNDPKALAAGLRRFPFWMGVRDFGIQVPFLFSTSSGANIGKKMYQTMRVTDCSAVTSDGKPGQFVGPNNDLISMDAWLKALPNWTPDPARPVADPKQITRPKKKGGA